MAIENRSKQWSQNEQSALLFEDHLSVRQIDLLGCIQTSLADNTAKINAISTIVYVLSKFILCIFICWLFLAHVCFLEGMGLKNLKVVGFHSFLLRQR